MIPLWRPWIPARSVELVTEAAGEGRVARSGVYTSRCVELLKRELKRRHVVLTCNGTTALMAAVHSVSSEPWVNVSDTTFAATANAPRLLGRKVRIVRGGDGWTVPRECYPADGLNIVVPAYGLLSKMGPTRPDDIIDACQAFGSPNLGDVNGHLVVSFFANKAVTSGEGGAFATDDTAVYRRALRFLDHGRPPGRRYIHHTVGANGHMPDLNAALLLGQLERLREIVASRTELVDGYRACLGSFSQRGVAFWPGKGADFPWCFALMLPGRRRLKSSVVEVRTGFPPVSAQRAYRDSVVVGDAARGRQIFMLPTWSFMEPSMRQQCFLELVQGLTDALSG